MFRRPAKRRSHETWIVDVGRATDKFVFAEKPVAIRGHAREQLAFAHPMAVTTKGRGMNVARANCSWGYSYCHNFEMAASAVAEHID